MREDFFRFLAQTTNEPIVLLLSLANNPPHILKSLIIRLFASFHADPHLLLPVLKNPDINPDIQESIPKNSPLGSRKITGLFAQYKYELKLGYLSLIGSTLSHPLSLLS